jgi:excisionase family DNA binding protein
VARTGARDGTGGAPDPDVLSAEQLAARLGIGDVQVVRRLAASKVIPGWRAGREWRFSWAEVYEWIAGPGIPDGKVVTAGELARRLGVGVLVVRRAAAAPGTPGAVPGTATIPGRLVGTQWRFAVQAVWRSLPDTSPALAMRLGIAPEAPSPG